MPRSARFFAEPAGVGTDPVSGDTQVAAVISQVRSGGGDVIVSAGGYNGTKLGQVCGTAAATAAAYQQVISTYGLHAFDFYSDTNVGSDIHADIVCDVDADQSRLLHGPRLVTGRYLRLR